MAKTRVKNELPARRKIALRVDSTVGSAEREIERMLKLPKGCVRLVKRNRRKARSDKLVGALLKEWGW